MGPTKTVCDLLASKPAVLQRCKAYVSAHMHLGPKSALCIPLLRASREMPAEFLKALSSIPNWEQIRMFVMMAEVRA